MRRNIKNWGNDILRAAIILLVLFYACFFGGYDRGDVVVFDYTDEDGQRQVIKRVIAVEGDRLEIVPEGVMVNGVLLDEPFTGLDEENRKKAEDYIRRKTRGRIVMIATHIRTGEEFSEMTQMQI